MKKIINNDNPLQLYKKVENASFDPSPFTQTGGKTTFFGNSSDLYF